MTSFLVGVMTRNLSNFLGVSQIEFFIFMSNRLTGLFTPVDWEGVWDGGWEWDVEGWLGFSFGFIEAM